MKSIGIGQKNFRFLAINISQCCCHNIKIHVQKRKRTEKISWETHKLLIFFWLWAKNFQFFVENWSTTLQKLHSICSRKKIDGKKFCRKNCSDSVFPVYESIFAGLFPKVWKFRRGCQNCNFNVQTNLLSVYFWNLFKIFLSLDFELKNCLDFGIKFWPLLSILQVTFPRERTSLEFLGSPLELLNLNAFPRFFDKKIGSIAKAALYFYLSIAKILISYFCKNIEVS